MTSTLDAGLVAKQFLGALCGGLFFGCVCLAAIIWTIEAKIRPWMARRREAREGTKLVDLEKATSGSTASSTSTPPKTPCLLSRGLGLEDPPQFTLGSPRVPPPAARSGAVGSRTNPFDDVDALFGRAVTPGPRGRPGSGLHMSGALQ